MPIIINAIEGQRLYELDEFHSMLTDDYLTNKKNIQTKFIFSQYFDNEDFESNERLALLNLSYSIPSLISDKFSDYVGQPVMDLDIDIEDFVSSFIWGGYGVFKSTVLEDEYKVVYTSPSEYIRDGANRERVLTFIYIYDDKDFLTEYVLEQTYEGPVLSNALYKVSKNAPKRQYTIVGEQVPLDTISATAGLEEVVDLELDKSPLTVVNNKKIENRIYGTSEIKRVRSLISSIEVQAVNIQDNFLKHLSAILALPVSKLKTNDEGMVEIDKLKAIGMENGDTLPSYIMNTNPLITDSFKQIEGFLRQICAILSIPIEFMGLNSPGGAESADAKRIRMTSFIKKVEKIRKKFSKGLENVEDIRRQWFNENSDEEFIVMWGPIFPEDPAQVLEQLAKAQDNKLITNKKAIMQYQNISEDEAEKEQKEIAEENATIDADDLSI